MMKRASLAILLLLASGCDRPSIYPDKKLVTEVEQALAKDSCVAPVRYWLRNYYFTLIRRDLRGQPVSDTNVLEFKFTQARGIDGRRMGNVEMPIVLNDSPPNEDGRSDVLGPAVAGGRYIIGAGELWLDYCTVDYEHDVFGRLVARRNAAGVLVPVS